MYLFIRSIVSGSAERILIQNRSRHPSQVVVGFLKKKEKDALTSQCSLTSLHCYHQSEQQLLSPVCSLTRWK